MAVDDCVPVDVLEDVSDDVAVPVEVVERVLCVGMQRSQGRPDRPLAVMIALFKHADPAATGCHVPYNPRELHCT